MTVKNQLYNIESLREFIEIIETVNGQNTKNFYRGVSCCDYDCIPSLYHKNGIYYKNEFNLYKDYVARFPDIFKNVSRLDTLATMQHYGLPTRLLDYTDNPLVALYMVCNTVFNDATTKNKPGEVIIFTPPENLIKYYDSDSVLILASLPLLTFEIKERLRNIINTNSGLKLADLKDIDSEVYLEFKRVMNKVYRVFDDNIDLDILKKAFFVKSPNINERIVAQAGGFIITGLDPYIIENEYRNKTKRIIVTNKEKILEELALVNISDETMLRDLDHVAKYLKKIYSK